MKYVKYSFIGSALNRFDLSRKFMGQIGVGYGEYDGLDFDHDYYKTTLVPTDFGVMYLLSHSIYVKPYLFGSVGGIYYKVKYKSFSSTPLSAYYSSLSVEDHGIAGFVEGGLVIQFNMGKSTALDFNAGFGYTSTDNLNYYRDGAAKDAYLFVGVGLLFGGGYVDSDGDGVPDYMDKCPNTPKGVKVDMFGCPIIKEEFKHFKLSGNANFNSGKADLLPAAYPVLDKLAEL
jgi:hypothetical protein